MTVVIQWGQKKYIYDPGDIFGVLDVVLPNFGSEWTSLTIQLDKDMRTKGSNFSGIRVCIMP